MTCYTFNAIDVHTHVLWSSFGCMNVYSSKVKSLLVIVYALTKAAERFNVYVYVSLTGVYIEL